MVTPKDSAGDDQRSADPFTAQPFLERQLHGADSIRAKSLGRRVDSDDIAARIDDLGVDRPDRAAFIKAVRRIDPDAPVPLERLPIDVRDTLRTIRPDVRRFHGAKFSLAYFPSREVFSRCADKFGYLTTAAVRAGSKLPLDATSRDLLTRLGGLMGDVGREATPDSAIPAGYTYVGQFVDHDITLDVSSSLDSPTEVDARTINNMRSPSLDLDSLYARGPALDPFMYTFPTSGPSTAIKLLTGVNQPAGPGGSGGIGGAGGMVERTDFDVPRASTMTAIIGDPRNDENLIVSQLHYVMVRFHNAVVDLLAAAAFSGDIFVEAKRVVTHHYQWAVVHDYLERVCGQTAVADALASVAAAPGSAFRMPVEFSVAAYRFGHSMIRDSYWLNFTFTNQPMSDVFAFIRPPLLPVFSNWVVDMNAFFDTGISVPVHNKARKIDSVLAAGLESLPGGAGIMAVLATRNLLRGLVLGLPSGQATATALGVPVLTAAELTQGLPADEVDLLHEAGDLLLTRTPLWYYILREAMVVENGERLGPLGAKIVADTFVRMLKRNAESFVNAGFAPTLPRQSAATFTFADIAIVAGVTQP